MDRTPPPGEGKVDAEPLIVDSWLVEEGCVRGLELHEDRFRRSCAKLVPSIPADALDAFLRSVRSLLPHRGRWFPRIEAYAGARAGPALRIRRAPASSGTIAIWVPLAPDPRARPDVKGPDLAALAALREQARLAGADDALLYTADRCVLETAHSAVVWWRGETLCLPAVELPVLPSITVTFLTALANRHGIEVSRERCPLDELLDLPVWSVNALHGIRPVHRWLTREGERPASTGPSPEQWIAWLEDRKTPITSAPENRAPETPGETLEGTVR